MEDVKFNPDSYCGLFCGSCEVYLATKNGQLDELAVKLNDKPENLACHGCKSQIVAPFCRTCQIKTSARSKNIDTCIECSTYPCSILTEFKEDIRWPYHTEVFDSLAYRKEHGFNRWLEYQRDLWSCSACNKAHNWYAQKCPNCNTKVHGYKRYEE